VITSEPADADGKSAVTTFGRSEVSGHLNRICGACALAFLLSVILLAVLEAKGVGNEIIGDVMLAVPLALYAGVGALSSTSDPSEFQFAGHRIPAAFAGMAAGAEWTSAALILGAPAALFAAGYDGRSVLIGLTGGYILLAVLIGPFLRNFAARTLPDFMAARYGGCVRFLAVIVLLVCSLIFMTALIQASVPVAARALAVNAEIALLVIMAVLLACALAGGAAGVTATQVAQYAVLLVGSLAVFFIYAARSYDAPAGAPYDPLAQAFDAVVKGLGLVPALSPRSIAFSMAQALDNLELTLCLMAGTASLPHILMHSLTTRSMGEARTSAVWTLVFITLLVFALPTYMTLANTAVSNEQGSVISALIPAIALTAMLAAASALLLTMGNSLDHDILCRRFAPPAPAKRRMIVARALMIIVAALAAYATEQGSFEPRSMLAWAFSLAAAGFFPALVLGIWWTRTTTAGAINGIIAGFGISLFYLVVTRYLPQAGISRFGMSALVDPTNGRSLVDAARVLADPKWLADVPASAANPLASKVGWFNISNAACGIFGLAASFLVTIGVSLLGKKPSATRRAVIEALRTPGAKSASP
jgi:cation/acetate symporter